MRKKGYCIRHYGDVLKMRTEAAFSLDRMKRSGKYPKEELEKAESEFKAQVKEAWKKLNGGY